VSDLAPGVTFSNRYRLESCLGTGGTAAVWAARDLDLGRAVAVKVLLGAGVDPELARRFEHEGMILGRLSHPNLVSVFATGEHEGRPYLVMQLVEGEPLNEVLRDGPLPTEDAVRLVADVAAGLAAAHRAGVVHRDVKPANIICRPDGSPVVVDFGIARVDDLTGVTRPNVVVGTANYLAPEQARGEQPGPPTDVYALGCVLQETLTGRPPLTADTPVAVAYRHVHDDPDPLPSDVPAGIAAIVARCLAKEPTARYPTAAELEADLRVRFATPANATAVLPPVTVATGGEVIDPSPLVEPDPGGHRWPLIAAIVAAVVLLALVLGNGFGGDGGSDTPPADARASTTTTIATTTTAAPPTTAAAPAPAPAPREGRGKGKHGKD
jgi:serine/threonine-protein kinase